MKKLLLILLALPAFCVAQKKLPTTFDLLIGTYTKGESKGIYVYRFYAETGKLAYLSEIDGITNPSYLCVSADGKFIYSVNENDKGSAVSAFKFDKVNGKIELINSQPTGAGPAYVSIDKGQKNIFVANYNGGSLTVVPVNKDGSLGAPSQTIQDSGSSINKERQAGPHVHAAMLSPDEKHLFYTDLGTDKLNIYKYKASKTPPLTPEEPSSVSVTPGNGPRHMEFSADGKFLYLIQEMSATVNVYSVDGGKLKQLQTIPMNEASFAGKSGAADIHLSPNGQYLYASNRGDADEIVQYIVNPVTGMLTFLERTRTMGKSPRNFVIDPTGKFLVVANQNTNSINVLSIDQKTGRLYPTRNNIKDISMPVCLKMVQVE